MLVAEMPGALERAIALLRTQSAVSVTGLETEMPHDPCASAGSAQEDGVVRSRL